MTAYAAALAASLLFAVNGTVVSLLLQGGNGPWLILAGRFWIAWICLSGYWIFSRKRPRAPIKGSRSVAIAFAAAVIASHLVFVLALAVMPVANAIVLVYLAPAILVISEAVNRRSLPGSWIVAAVALAIAGAILVLRPTADQEVSPGTILLAVMLPLTYAAYMTVAGRLPATMDTTSLLWWTWGAASVVAAPFVLGSAPEFSVAAVAGLLYLGMLGTLLGFLLIVEAVRRASASRISIVAVSEVPLATIAAWLVLGQPIDGIQAAGAGMVAMAVAIVYLQRQESYQGPRSE